MSLTVLVGVFNENSQLLNTQLHTDHTQTAMCVIFGFHFTVHTCITHTVILSLDDHADSNSNSYITTVMFTLHLQHIVTLNFMAPHKYSYLHILS